MHKQRGQKMIGFRLVVKGFSCPIFRLFLCLTRLPLWQLPSRLIFNEKTFLFFGRCILTLFLHTFQGQKVLATARAPCARNFFITSMKRPKFQKSSAFQGYYTKLSAASCRHVFALKGSFLSFGPLLDVSALYKKKALRNFLKRRYF